MVEALANNYRLSPYDKMEAILKAVRKHVKIQQQPTHPYLADTATEPDQQTARILACGFSNMLGVHHTEVCAWLSCEDGEYFTSLKNFKLYLCSPVGSNKAAFKKDIPARYIVKYRKVANELGLNGLYPSAEENAAYQ
jgi:hypothetical protein